MSLIGRFWASPEDGTKLHDARVLPTWRPDIHECPVCQICDGSGWISAGRIQKPEFVKGINMEQLTEYIATAFDEGFQVGTEPALSESDSPEEELEEDLESESEESTPSEE